MGLDPTERMQQWFSVFVYALSGVTLTCALRYIPYENTSPIFVVLQFVPLAFLVLYVRFLLQSASKRQRSLAVGLICVSAFAVAGYLWSRPYWPPPATPNFRILIAGVVVVVSTLVIATLALLLHHKIAYTASTAAAILLWLWILEASLSGRDVGPHGLGRLAGVIALYGFAIAATTLLSRPTFAYCVGLLATALAVPYIIGRETSYRYHGNSWLVLNLPGGRFYHQELIYAELSILTVVAVVISAMISLLRLCPDAWQFRGRAIRTRTWPAFPLSFLIVGAWFIESATPYWLPTEHGGISPEVSVVHFERQGPSSTETRVVVTRDGRLYFSHDVRKPFRYESDGEMSEGAVQAWEKVQPILEFLRSADFKAQGGSFTRDLPRHWDSETWYVYGERIPFKIFSTVNDTAPPKEIVDWFNDMNKLPTKNPWHLNRRDVCLGFCYEPQL